MMMMSDTFRQGLFMLLGGVVYFMLLPIHAQDDQSGFVSIDCGFIKSSSYIEKTTKLKYTSDAEFVDTGETKSVLNQYRDMYQQPYGPLRSFPEGDRNCYKINITRGAKYLIRTSFIYGNYDGQNKLPEFELHLGPDLWDTVKLDGVSVITSKELIHIPRRNYVHICLVNTGNGAPFISAIELRPLPNGTYQTQTGSLALSWRFDTGVLGLNYFVAYRYPVDVHDRFWAGYKDESKWAQLHSSSTIISGENTYQLPYVAMSTASTPKDGQSTLNIGWMPPENAVETEYWVCMHFAEVEQLQPNESRQMYITWNGQLLVSQFSPSTLPSSTLYISKTVVKGGRFDLSIVKAATSTLPPILNAIEIYTVKEFLQSETNEEDINAITSIKSTYKIQKNWQGDPCSPEVYLWEGLKCSYNKNEPPRIISLDLSSSVLTGEIAPSISKLAMLQTLDLSNNNLTGSIPGSLSQLQKLNALKLEKNKLTGSVPEGLNDRWKNGSLSLSFCENPNLSGEVSCKKKNSIVLIVAPAILGSIIIFLGIGSGIWWRFFKSGVAPPEDQEAMLSEGPVSELPVSAPRGRNFTKDEIEEITSNYKNMIGKGGFGEVFYGKLRDQTEVAVKKLPHSAPHEDLDTLITEVEILMNVRHKNIVPLIGYCGEADAVALVYEYMPQGSLENKLFPDGDHDGVMLIWKKRLEIALDIARGIQYLHTHSEKAIVHRDIKPDNILLAKNLQAKIADFGIAKVFASEKSTHVTTNVIGTEGYYDPECDNDLKTVSDVYSFGIVLLQLITGRKLEWTEEQQDGTKVTIKIADWLGREAENSRIKNIVDPKSQERYKFSPSQIEIIVDSKLKYKIDSAEKAIVTAVKCVLTKSPKRPKIDYAMNILEECLEIEETATKDEATSPGI